MKILSEKLSILSNKYAFAYSLKLLTASWICIATYQEVYPFDSMLKSNGHDDCLMVTVEPGDSVEIINRSIGVKNQTFEIGFTHPKKKVDFSFLLQSSDHDTESLSLTIRQDQSNFGEFDHSIFLYLDVKQGDNPVKTIKLDKNIGINSDPNFLRVEIYNQGTYISTGKESLTDRISLPFTGFYSRGLASFREGGTIIRRMASFEPDGQFSLSKCLNEDDARRIILEDNTNAPIVGLWELMDYNVEATQAQIGGNYKIAVLPTDNDGFEIVYLGGAKKVDHRWKEGMIKGMFQPTIFVGNYDMTWIDAEGCAISEGCYARLESDDILTLEFPLQKSQMRFVKMR